MSLLSPHTLHTHACLQLMRCFGMLSTPGKKLTEAELNSLIAHAHRRIDQLQKQLAEQIAMETQRTQKAIEQQKAEGEKLAADLVKKEAERLQNEFSLEKQKWVRMCRFRVLTFYLHDICFHRFFW